MRVGRADERTETVKQGKQLSCKVRLQVLGGECGAGGQPMFDELQLNERLV